MFTLWGKAVAALPWCFIILGMILALITSLGFLFGETDDEPTRVWIPTDSAAIDNKDDVEDLYGEGDAIRYTIYITAKDQYAPNLLTPEAMQEIVNLDKAIKNVKSDGMTYDDICEKLNKNDRCTQYESPL